MKEKPIRILQLSDLHLFEKKEEALLGVNTQESFSAILKQIKEESKNKNINCIILSGDLSQDYTKTAYERIADELSFFKVPIYYVPGNHDDLEVMFQVYPRGYLSNQRTVILKNWQIILLNSNLPHKVEGYFNKDQLELLRISLDTYPEHHALIVFHHHPVPVGSKWLDPIGLSNANEFWEMIKEDQQVRVVLFGHIHQEFLGKKNGISVYAPPSCCIQFKPKQEDFLLDHIPPGYRYIDLYSNGCFQTEISRLSHYIGTFDPQAKGY